MQRRSSPPRLSDNGRYVVGRRIGAGGQGEVFEARHLELDRSVAIKRLFDPGRIRHEARILASMRHPNLLTVYELVELQGEPALVLEYIDGPDLCTLLAHADVDGQTALNLWLGIVKGLCHAHARGIIHGDLSPSNVMIDVNGGDIEPKICDFGVGRSPENPGRLVGQTEGFVAPELRQGELPTTRCDVYSVGILARYLMPCHCPPELEPLISRCTSADPLVRPEDAVALSRLIDERLHGRPPTEVEVGGPPAVPRAVVALWAGVGIACGSVVGAGVVALGVAADAEAIDPSLALAALARVDSHPAEAAALWHAAGAPIPPEARAVGADSRTLPHPDIVTDLAARGPNLLTADATGVIREYDVSTGEVLRTVETGVTHPVDLMTAGNSLTLRPHPVWGTRSTDCIAWSIDSAACIARPAHGAAHLVLLSPRGEYLWYATESRETSVVSLDTGEHLWQMDHEDVLSAATRPDLPDVFAVASGGRLEVVSYRTGHRRLVSEALPAHVPKLIWLDGAFHWSDRESVSRLTADGRIETRPSRGELLGASELGITHAGGRSRFGTLHGPDAMWPIRHTGYSRPVAWGGPSLLASSPLDGPIELIDARTGYRQRVMVGHTASLTDMVVVGNWLATSSMDYTVRLWRPRDADSGWLRRTDLGMSPSMTAMGDDLAVLGRLDDDRWAVWTSDAGIRPIGIASAGWIDREARVVVTMDESSVLSVLQLADGSLRRTASSVRGPRCVRPSLSTDRVLVTGKTSYALHRLSDGTELSSGMLHTEHVGCGVIDNDGTLWFARENEPRVVSLDGRPLAVPFDGPVAGLTVSESGLAVHGFRGEISVVEDGVLELVGRDATTYAMTHDQLAWASLDGRVHSRVSVPTEGSPSWSTEPGSRVYAMTWAAGEAILVAGRANGILDAWTRSGQHVASIQAHDTRIISLSVQPTTGHIVSVDIDGAVQRWEPGSMMAEPLPVVTNLRACPHASRAVPVIPFPEAMQRWAPDHLCEET